MLTNLINIIDKSIYNIIITGDANGRLGELTGDKKWDKNGIKLVNLCNKFNFKIINSILLYNIATYHKLWDIDIFNKINNESINDIHNNINNSSVCMYENIMNINNVK